MYKQNFIDILKFLVTVEFITYFIYIYCFDILLYVTHKLLHN